ncbi:hypothetical protein [Rhodococcus sp. WB9]|uniref:hypothetical protein n=1 Tax=Rhodococcus sp. WB9 TaxID=2594007 RepID=UPI0037C974C9
MANEFAGEVLIAEPGVDRGDTPTDQIIEQGAFGDGAAQLLHHGDVVGDQSDPWALALDQGVGAPRCGVADVFGAVQQLPAEPAARQFR